MNAEYKEIATNGRYIVDFCISLSKKDVQESLKQSWQVGHYHGRRCLHNAKSIFIPDYMPLP